MSNTARLVAHATGDENGGDPYMGLAGSQNGVELVAQQWYEHNWDCVYRAAKPEHREQIAMFMEKAVSNGFIGYDSNKNARDTLFEALGKNGYKVDEINTSVECDCSALVYCAVYPVTGVECYISPERKESAKIKTCPKVNDYADYLENQCAGMFEKLDGSIYDSVDQYGNHGVELLRGDILVELGNHIAVWV